MQFDLTDALKSAFWVNRETEVFVLYCSCNIGDNGLICKIKNNTEHQQKAYIDQNK